MIFLIVSNLLLNKAIAENSTKSATYPLVQTLTNSVKIELPLPVETERQKFIINVSSENGFICHNFLREKEIKDKLFSLEAVKNTVPELETMVLEKKEPVSFISGSTSQSASVGMVLGLIMGFFIFKK